LIPGWKDDIVSAYLGILRQHPGATPVEVAAHLGVSEGCAIYWLTDLARDGRIRIGSVELVEDGVIQPRRTVHHVTTASTSSEGG
jgi:hypothetical protein